MTGSVLLIIIMAYGSDRRYGYKQVSGEKVMKTVLCFGDSNTFGYDPESGLRYPRDVRWTGVLQKLLGSGYTVIEEGCNGRTTVFEDPVEGWKKGIDYLKPCLSTHRPVDLVIIMLGTNDLKRCFGTTAADSAGGAGVLVDVIKDFMPLKQGFAPQIILVSPIRLGENIENSPFSASFAKSAVEESYRFADEFSRVAEEKGCIFFDAASVASASAADSLHMDRASHTRLAEALCGLIKSNLT